MFELIERTKGLEWFFSLSQLLCNGMYAHGLKSLSKSHMTLNVWLKPFMKCVRSETCDLSY